MQFYHSKYPSKLLLIVVIAMAFLGVACAVSTTDGKTSSPDSDPYLFVPVDNEPYTDMMLLQSALIYPSEAKRLGIQGKVYIRVLVNKKGIP